MLSRKHLLQWIYIVPIYSKPLYTCTLHLFRLCSSAFYLKILYKRRCYAVNMVVVKKYQTSASDPNRKFLFTFSSLLLTMLKTLVRNLIKNKCIYLVRRKKKKLFIYDPIVTVIFLLYITKKKLLFLCEFLMYIPDQKNNYFLIIDAEYLTFIKRFFSSEKRSY